MAAITQLGPGAYPGQRYGSFAGKTQAAAAQVWEVRDASVPAYAFRDASVPAYELRDRSEP